MHCSTGVSSLIKCLEDLDLTYENELVNKSETDVVRFEMDLFKETRNHKPNIIKARLVKKGCINKVDCILLLP